MASKVKQPYDFKPFIVCNYVRNNLFSAVK